MYYMCMRGCWHAFRLPFASINDFYGIPKNTRLHFTRSVLYGKWNPSSGEYYPHLHVSSMITMYVCVVLCMFCICSVYFLFFFVSMCSWRHIYNTFLFQHLIETEPTTQTSTFDYFLFHFVWECCCERPLSCVRYNKYHYILFTNETDRGRSSRIKNTTNWRWDR